ncbi:MAG: VacJ family lipoprotein [Deltaproteobacteria bacterium]|jgi:ABC-type transporter lipoprotein component MlaA|nr:VacJ family lipoprotein [Deltaproteobacteria bacterium]
MRSRALIHPLCAALLVLTGCQATLKARDWSSYEGPGRAYFLKEEIELPFIGDPLEPMNRGIAGFNHGLMVGLVSPLAGIYRLIFPRQIRSGIGNVFENLLFPVRLVSNLLQGKGGGAWRETARFGVNTTIGFAGILDSATAMGIAASREDFGQTFGRWGWRNSSYLMIPIMGPSTIRDGFGEIGNAAVDPLTYIPFSSMVRGFNKASDAVIPYKQFVRSNFDPYQLGRRLYVMSRDLAIDDYHYSTESDKTGETETLQAVFFTNQQEKFPWKGKTRSVEIPTTGRKLPYTVWLQQKRAPLVFFIPGIGGHRRGNSTLGVAEALYRNGNSVVTISNPLNFEFIESASSAKFPGFAPVDARDAHVALDAIARDVQERFPERFTEERSLVGISLGGLHTLFIAADENSSDHELVAFDKYVALNAPVNYEYAVKKLDLFYNAPLAFPAEEREEQIAQILRKVLDLAEGTLEPGMELPFTRLESEFLIGLSFRTLLASIIFQTARDGEGDVLKTGGGSWRRAMAYREIEQYSFMEYMYAFVLPYYAEQRADIRFSEYGAQRMFELSDLRSIERGLANNDKVFFVSNRNDFLLRSQDVSWAEALFPSRAHFFERGGHLGNLHRQDIREAIKRFVNKPRG